ncbi:MAG TPA: DUF1549 and DUF1553 domain-containing protein [Pirellulaceae bacterium]|jgi:hypothetical protein
MVRAFGSRILRESCWFAAFVCVCAAVPRDSIAADGDSYSATEKSHWSLQPRAMVRPPVAEEASAVAFTRGPVDAFVFERLKKAGLEPAGEATPRALVRRLTFNLLGLPPAPEEIDALVADRAPDAYERLVDRLLANPHFGEAWAQHWLDVVRYAESEGFEYDRHRPGAWQFRDYVIESFNEDKPFDRFVMEQVAGDEVAASEADREPYVAAGFHRLGPVRRNAGNSDVAFSRNEVLTELTDAIGASFLGLTVGCARCHDHMFDAIRQRDYYRLQAFFAATQEKDIQIGEAEAVKRWNEENDAIQAEIKRLKELIDDAVGEDRDKLTYDLKKVQKKAPTPLPTISTVANDGAKRSDVRILERGQTDKPKELVGPRVLGVLLTSSAAELPPDLSSPKTQLAKWLIDPEHPLTARVFVNRLWQYQFGQGIVATPNDFGVNGGQPSHPQLLDYLANELVRGGWSTKRMVRKIVESGAFRQSSESKVQGPKSKVGNAGTIDPDDRLLWRFPRRRLTAEEARDGMLMVAGRLNARFGGESVMPPVKQELVDLLYEPAQWQVTPDKREHDRRSVYLVAKRNLKLPFMEVFDQPDLLTSCARRQSSTHSPQALELLNGELASEMAGALAKRLRQEAGDDPVRIVERAFLLTAGREPTAAERKIGLAFVKSQPLEEFALAMFNLNAFLYVD